jgi:hypothetical protein
MGESWGQAAALQNQDERRAPDCHIGRELERLEGVRCITARRRLSLLGTIVARPRMTALSAQCVPVEANASCYLW